MDQLAAGEGQQPVVARGQCQLLGDAHPSALACRAPGVRWSGNRAGPCDRHSRPPNNRELPDEPGNALPPAFAPVGPANACAIDQSDRFVDPSFRRRGRRTRLAPGPANRRPAASLCRAKIAGAVSRSPASGTRSSDSPSSGMVEVAGVEVQQRSILPGRENMISLVGKEQIVGQPLFVGLSPGQLGGRRLDDRFARQQIFAAMGRVQLEPALGRKYAKHLAVGPGRIVDPPDRVGAAGFRPPDPTRPPGGADETGPRRHASTPPRSSTATSPGPQLAVAVRAAPPARQTSS